MNKRIAGTLLMLLLSGCGNDKNNAASLPMIILVSPSAGAASPSSAASSSPTSISVMSTAKFTIRIPQLKTAGFKVAHVSSSTLSIAIVANGGAPNVINVVPGQQTYSATVQVPAGQNTFHVKLYDSLNAGGNMLDTGSVSANIIRGQANPIDLILGGVTASLQLVPQTSAPAIGSPRDISLGVVAKDASGAQIIGAYSNPIALTDGTTSTQAMVLSTASVADSGSAVNIHYDGASNQAEQFCASVPGVAQVCTTLTPAVAAQGVSTNPSSATVQTLNTITLAATVALSDGTTETSVTWSSSNPAIATVNQSGAVTGVAPGSATITAASTRDPSKSVAVPITVPVATASTPTISPSSLSLQVGQSAQLSAGVPLSNGTVDNTVTWSSSNLGVATVGPTGLVTALTAGSVTITATSVLDPTKSASVPVTTSASALSASPASLDFTDIAQTATFTVSQQGYAGPYTALPVCTSSGGAAIATVAFTTNPANFLVTSLAAGSCTITVTGQGGQTSTVAVNVTTTSLILH